MPSPPGSGNASDEKPSVEATGNTKQPAETSGETAVVEADAVEQYEGGSSDEEWEQQDDNTDNSQ